MGSLKTAAIGFFFAVVSAGTLACGVSGQPEPTSDSSETQSAEVAIRQTDASGRRLPFTTTFPDRWNVNNDETEYEPCTGLQEETLKRNGIVARSVRDAALSNFQTLRGCQWDLVDGQHAVAFQFVGDLSRDVRDLKDYKRENDYGVWYPDLVIDGRQVAVNATDNVRCEALVVSNHALVTTGFDISYVGGPDIEQVCARAIRLLRESILGIPK
ncbi:DUF3558 family protein [Gordonia sp. 'Campus']|uniref:DUF3558 family protein n=1 Tax=Gordonia sp. 'Campus' TaxID=2915824 RepID=UPI001EE49536|nr:DUF3558 family protein [Gordonia sp. 'Campus']